MKTPSFRLDNTYFRILSIFATNINTKNTPDIKHRPEDKAVPLSIIQTDATNVIPDNIDNKYSTNFFNLFFLLIRFPLFRLILTTSTYVII